MLRGSSFLQILPLSVDLNQEKNSSTFLDKRFWRIWTLFGVGIWSAAVFLPVGFTYAGLVCVVLGLSMEGQWLERWQDLRKSALFWPLLGLFIWTLFIGVLRPYYHPQTLSNGFHLLRIILTISLAMLLTRQEALWAWRSFLSMGFLSLLLIIWSYFYPSIRSWELLYPWHKVMFMGGNKSINNALLLTLFGLSFLIWSWHSSKLNFWKRYLVAIPILALVVWLISAGPLSSRSSMFVLIFVVPLLYFHKQNHLSWVQVLSGVSLFVLLVSGLSLIPNVQGRVLQGWDHLYIAWMGNVQETSWGIRFHMYRVALELIREQPWLGWGIGAWNQLWAVREPTLSHVNMPHNDYLWMGVQAGIPGVLFFASLFFCGVYITWKKSGFSGQLAFAALLTISIACLFNSATRDAQIGLGLLWIAMICLRLACVPVKESKIQERDI